MSNLPLAALYLDRCTWQYIRLFFFPYRFHSQQENSPDFSGTVTGLASHEELAGAAGGVQAEGAAGNISWLSRFPAGPGEGICCLVEAFGGAQCCVQTAPRKSGTLFGTELKLVLRLLCPVLPSLLFLLLLQAMMLLGSVGLPLHCISWGGDGGTLNWISSTCREQLLVEKHPQTSSKETTRSLCVLWGQEEQCQEGELCARRVPGVLGLCWPQKVQMGFCISLLSWPRQGSGRSF